jgi:peptide-methionine (S)-S-oxide reductase
VSFGNTGHAESVKIVFDPAEVSYGQLLQIAFSVVHDPTQLNRQGPDVGTQYRSAVFYADDAQKRIAEAYISQLDKSHAYPRPIVTRVDPLKGFYAAEDYHQDYLIHNPNVPYIAMFDIPKVENFKRTFPELYSGRPVLVRN